MFSVGTEYQTEEVALVHFFAKALVRIVQKLIGLEIENGDRLHTHRLLRAVAVVEKGGITAIRTKRDGGGKAVGPPEPARGRNRQRLACGERNCRLCALLLLRGKHVLHCEKYNRENDAAESDHRPSAWSYCDSRKMERDERNLCANLWSKQRKRTGSSGEIERSKSSRFRKRA